MIAVSPSPTRPAPVAVDLRSGNASDEKQKRGSLYGFLGLTCGLTIVSIYIGARDVSRAIQGSLPTSQQYLDVVFWAVTVLLGVQMALSYREMMPGLTSIEVSDAGVRLTLPSGAVEQLNWQDPTFELTVYEHRRLPGLNQGVVYRGTRTPLPKEVVTTIFDYAHLLSLPMEERTGFVWMPALRPTFTRIGRGNASNRVSAPTG